MTEPTFEIDAAWQALTKAREQGDNGAESIALTVLGQALVEAGREDAFFFEQQAFRFGDKDGQLFAQAEVLLRRAEALETMGSAVPRQVEDRIPSEMALPELSAGPNRLGERRAAEAAQQVTEVAA